MIDHAILQWALWFLFNILDNYQKTKKTDMSGKLRAALDYPHKKFPDLNVRQIILAVVANTQTRTLGQTPFVY